LEIQDFQKAAAGMLRVMELQNIKSNIHYGNETLPVGPLSVAFQNVSFNYNRPSETENTNNALSDVTFSLQAGRSLGIVGRTGSGKTSLTRLLLRLYDPTSGSIQLGGMEIGSIQLKSLRERVAVVTQEVQLFNATIRENLTLFDPSIPDEKIINAIVDVGLKDWLDLQPNGLDTILASGGDLSAGQAQLLAFTRVFLRDPGLVILDEASSRLDPATESLIEKAVTKLLKDRTAIIIAHRLNTLDRVDDILVMGDGRVLEFGPREQLKAESDSVFSNLLKQGFEEVTA
jgi:ATP-binding cassette subfamily B protein/ATP-binding cassette subfamily C protein